MPVKSCKDCGVVKSLGEFYEHPRMADGHLNSCKECKKLYARSKPYDAEYERQRAQKPERKTKKLEYQRRLRVAHPEKYRARQLVSNAIRDGNLKRGQCEVCGMAGEAHHEDYSQPFNVRWLCFVHHRKAHGQTVARLSS